MNADALAIAGAVRARRVSALEVVRAALDRIAMRDPAINAFTAVTAESAPADAARIDAVVASGGDPGPLAGAPFAVKNLFDVAGLVTLAGSRINADRPPATRDATIMAALRRAGAVLVGALNMDEYAYGFTTENSHHGATRNPHDPARVAGGSSGGYATPWAATLIGQDMISIGGESLPIRPNFGLYTQPLSFIGLPVLAAPIARPGGLPRGLQIVGAPFNEALLFRVAAVLEAKGVVGANLAAEARAAVA